MIVSPNTRIARSLSVMAAGQSLVNFLTYEEAGIAFVNRLQKKVSLPFGILLPPAAAHGGSFILKTHDDAINPSPPPGGASAYWIDDTVSPWVNGTALTASVTAIAQLSGADISTIIIWDQSYADEPFSSGTVDGFDPTVEVPKMKTAWLQTFAALRSMLNAGSPSSVPVFIVLPGRELASSNPMGMERNRQALLQVATADTNFIVIDGTYCAELLNNPHPSSPVGQTTYGTIIADVVAKKLGASGIFLGPSIASVTKVNATTLAIVIIPEVGDAVVWPDATTGFCGFAFADSAAPISQVNRAYTNRINALSWARSGSTITVTVDTPIVHDPVLYYPFDLIADFDPRRLIASASGKPLRTWFRG